LGGTGVEFFAPIARALWVASLAAQVILIGRLAQERLLRRYFFFAAYLAAETIFGVLLIQIDFKTPAYAQAFSAYTTVILILRIAMGAELWERVCEHFPGMGRFRFNLAGVFVAPAALLVWSYEPHLASQWAFPQTLMLVMKRFQSEITAAVFIGLWLFLRHLMQARPAWRPNVLNHWRIATVYFGIGGLTSLAVLIAGGGKWVNPINCLMLAVDLGCLLTWTRCFSRAGETLPATPHLSEIEIQEIRERNEEIFKLVMSLPAEIKRQSADTRAARRSMRY
jgi:hypothetical protein